MINFKALRIEREHWQPFTDCYCVAELCVLYIQTKRRHTFEVRLVIFYVAWKSTCHQRYYAAERIPVWRKTVLGLLKVRNGRKFRDLNAAEENLVNLVHLLESGLYCRQQFGVRTLFVVCRPLQKSNCVHKILSGHIQLQDTFLEFRLAID